jgi:hypothetical protein
MGAIRIITLIRVGAWYHRQLSNKEFHTSITVLVAASPHRALLIQYRLKLSLSRSPTVPLYSHGWPPTIPVPYLARLFVSRVLGGQISRQYPGRPGYQV